MIPFLDAEVEWRNPAEGVAGVFYGHEGVRQRFRQTDEAFDEIHFELDRIEEAPDGRLLAIMRARVKVVDGVETEVPLAHVIEMRAGKGARRYAVHKHWRGPRSRGAAAVGEPSGGILALL